MKKIPQIKLDLVIDEKAFNRNVNDDLSVNPENLTESLTQQASLYAYYAIRLQQLNAARDQSEFDLDRAKNKLIHETRMMFFEQGKKITDKQLIAIIENDDQVVKLRNIYLKLCSSRDQLFSLVKAIDHKKDTIIALAYMRKSELEMIGKNTIYKKRSIPNAGIDDD